MIDLERARHFLKSTQWAGWSQSALCSLPRSGSACFRTSSSMTRNGGSSRFTIMPHVFYELRSRLQLLRLVRQLIVCAAPYAVGDPQFRPDARAARLRDRRARHLCRADARQRPVRRAPRHGNPARQRIAGLGSRAKHTGLRRLHHSFRSNKPWNSYLGVIEHTYKPDRMMETPNTLQADGEAGADPGSLLWTLPTYGKRWDALQDA